MVYDIEMGHNIKEKAEKTENEEIFERINKKIDSLYNVLRPVYSENQEPNLEKVEKTSSPLINKLQDIEKRITELLDGIRL